MRILLSLVLAASAVTWLAVTPVQADTPVTYTDEGRALFRFEVPDFWTLRTGGPREIEDTNLGDARAVSRVMGIRPVTDDNVWMGFVSPSRVSSIQGGLSYLEDIDKFLVKDPTVTSTSNTRIGGRNVGKRKNRRIHLNFW